MATILKIAERPEQSSTDSNVVHGVCSLCESD